MLAPVGGSDAAKTKLRKSKKKKKKQEVIGGGRDQFFVFFPMLLKVYSTRSPMVLSSTCPAVISHRLRLYQWTVASSFLPK